MKKLEIARLDIITCENGNVKGFIDAKLISAGFDLEKPYAWECDEVSGNYTFTQCGEDDKVVIRNPSLDKTDIKLLTFRGLDHDGDVPLGGRFLSFEKYDQAFEKARELIMAMNGLSDDGFKTKYMRDPCFNKGFNVIVSLIKESGFEMF